MCTSIKTFNHYTHPYKLLRQKWCMFVFATKFDNYSFRSGTFFFSSKQVIFHIGVRDKCLWFYTRENLGWNILILMNLDVNGVYYVMSLFVHLMVMRNAHHLVQSSMEGMWWCSEMIWLCVLWMRHFFSWKRVRYAHVNRTDFQLLWYVVLLNFVIWLWFSYLYTITWI